MSASAAIVPIDVVSDVVCPWCYIGKRRLEKALRLRPEIQTEIRWQPYFLNVWVPRQGISREEYLRTKFGSVERYAQISERIKAAGEAEGLPLALDKISRQPNTLDCHRLLRWAHANGNASALKERLMQLYFVEGADLTDAEILIGAARDCGMDESAVRERLAGDDDVEAVERQAHTAQEAGIQGVPYFIFGGVLAVSGAQESEYLAGALDRAAKEFTQREAEAAAG